MAQNKFTQATLGDTKPQAYPKGLCVESCYTATEEKCTCRCNGAYHGKAHAKDETEEEA